MKTKSKLNERKAEIMVKEQLWRNGYSVKDMARYADYDLLINDNIKVEVKSAEYQQTQEGMYWKLRGLRIKPNSADILAAVVTTPLKDTLIFYVKLTEKNFKEFEEHKLIKNDKVKGGNIVTCDLRITPDILKVCFTDSPAKVFNN